MRLIVGIVLAAAVSAKAVRVRATGVSPNSDMYRPINSICLLATVNQGDCWT